MGHTRFCRTIYRWQFCSSQDGGDGIGNTKRGMGFKTLAIADRHDLPVAVSTIGKLPCNTRYEYYETNYLGFLQMAFVIL